MLVLIPLALSCLLLFLSDNHFTLWPYQLGAGVLLLALISVISEELNGARRFATYFLMGAAGLAGSYFFGVDAVFFACALVIGIVFVMVGVSAMTTLIKPDPGSGSVITAMFVFAPIGLVLGVYYFAIGYQGLALDHYLGLASYIPILRV